MERPPQKLYTKKYGELDVVTSWNEPPNHIALLSNGAFVHITGVPVTDKSDLRKTIHDLKVLEEALYWFDHRHENRGPDVLRVMIDGDDVVFEDGIPIENISQLTSAMKPGPLLDAAVSWFTKRLDAAKATTGQKGDPAKPPVKAKPRGAAKKMAIKAKKAKAPSGPVEMTA
jgi:hypothetical protein